MKEIKNYRLSSLKSVITKKLKAVESLNHTPFFSIHQFVHIELSNYVVYLNFAVKFTVLKIATVSI